MIGVDDNTFVLETLGEHRVCSKCGGRGDVKGITCDCLRRLKLVMNGHQAGVPDQKLKAIVKQGVYEKEVRTWDFIANRWTNPRKMNKDFLEPYLADIPKMISESRSFLFLGANSTGKTIALSYLISQIAYRQNSCMFMRFDKFLRSFWNLGDHSDSQLADNAFACTFLALDEVGKQRTKEGVISALECILKEREERMRPTFVATNKTLKEFREDYGVSIFSLLRENYIIFEFDPRADYRLESRKEWDSKDTNKKS